MVPRISDVYAALPSLTGKFELEYEGELMGAENVGRELIREAVGEVFSVYLGAADLRPVVSFFEAGGSLRLREDAPSQELLAQLQRIPSLMGHISALGASAGDPVTVQVAAAEFVLEGLWSQKKIGRSDERVFTAPERRNEDSDLERIERLRKMKKQVN